MKDDNSSSFQKYFPVVAVSIMAVTLSTAVVLLSKSSLNFFGADTVSSTELLAIKIEPDEATLAPGEEQKFMAIGVYSTGEAPMRVQWSLSPEDLGKLNCGSYTSDCVFTAGSKTQQGKVKIKSGSLKDEAKVVITGEAFKMPADVHPEDWFYNPVYNVLKLDIMKGKSDGNFYPGEASNRADFVVVDSRLLSVLKVPVSASTTCNTFSDVPADHYGAPAICSFSGMGWVKGVSEGVFGVSQPVTREQAAKIIYVSLEQKLASIPEKTVSDYTDVPPDRWSYKYVMDLSKRGIFSGKKPGIFDPEGQINRAELAAVMDRLEQAL